jgi:hypothetical protein
MTESNRPGLARCSSSRSAESTLRAKARFEKLIEAAGLAGENNGRELARILGKGESTVRGWRNPDALDRHPSEEAFEKLERLAQFNELAREFGKLG